MYKDLIRSTLSSKVGKILGKFVVGEFDVRNNFSSGNFF
jgi:hypothetical protein